MAQEDDPLPCEDEFSDYDREIRYRRPLPAVCPHGSNPDDCEDYLCNFLRGEREEEDENSDGGMVEFDDGENFYEEYLGKASVDANTALDAAEDALASDAAQDFDARVSSIRCNQQHCPNKPFLDKYFFADGSVKLECPSCEAHVLFCEDENGVVTATIEDQFGDIHLPTKKTKGSLKEDGHR